MLVFRNIINPPKLRPRLFISEAAACFQLTLELGASTHWYKDAISS